MKFRLITLAIIFQILALLGMLAYAYAPIYFGKEIKIDVNLYDPRDFLRGNYVSLNYDFSRVDEAFVDENSSGKKIYAILKEDKDGVYKFTKHSLTEPANETFIAGRISYGEFASFGIEAFFLPVKKAPQMERDIREDGAWAIVSVMDNGKARVKDIILKPKIELDLNDGIDQGNLTQNLESEDNKTTK